MTLDNIAVIGLFALAGAGVAYALIYPYLSGETKADERREAVSAPVRAKRGEEVKARKGNVEDTLKEIERRQKNASRPPLNVKLAQAGLTWTKNQFIVFSAVMAGVGLFVAMLMNLPPLWFLPVMVVFGIGMPNWFLKFKKKRRINAFLHELPNAVDVIVRGVKAGLPIGDCLRMIATESQEPVKSEFRYIIEQTQLGIPLADAVLKIYERMPVAEANFFSIVISIQQKAGGNLSESLGNLSKVLRDRKKMKGKVQSMSQEAKSSAAIIGALPPLVMLFVYVTTPTYIMLLFETQMGHMLLAGCAFWMFCGVMVMRKMINFDI